MACFVYVLVEGPFWCGATKRIFLDVKWQDMFQISQVLLVIFFCAGRRFDKSFCFLYRTYQKVPIPVAAPMSPVGSDYSLDLKSPTSSQCFSPVPRLEAVNEAMEAVSENTATIPAFEKTYESLKSTCSSQNR